MSDDTIKVVQLRVGYVLRGCPPLRPGTEVALPGAAADRLLSKGRARLVPAPEPPAEPSDEPDPAVDAFLNPDVEVDGNRDQL